MSTERTINVYKIDELTGRAKERAIEDLQRAAHEFFDPENLQEIFKSELDEAGLPSDDIRWRLSNCQGDGVAFYGRFDLKEYVKLNKLWNKYRKIAHLFNEASADIEKRGDFHMYDHWNTMRVQINCFNTTRAQDKLFNELQEEIQEHTKELSHKLEKIGYAEIEYQTSEEVVVDQARMNDYEFDEDGYRID